MYTREADKTILNIPVSPGAGCNETDAGQCGGTSKKNGNAYAPSFFIKRS